MPGHDGTVGQAGEVGIQDDAERIHPETRAEWRAWLAANHDRPDGVWVILWNRHAGRPAPSYDDAVEEALCFGWIDSVVHKLDADRRMQWYSPRRKGSGWSRPNKIRLERVEAAGLMTPAGRRVLDAAKADGSWTRHDEVEDRIVPDDLAAAFAGAARFPRALGRVHGVAAEGGPRLDRHREASRHAPEAGRRGR